MAGLHTELGSWGAEKANVIPSNQEARFNPKERASWDQHSHEDTGEPTEVKEEMCVWWFKRSDPPRGGWAAASAHAYVLTSGDRWFGLEVGQASQEAPGNHFFGELRVGLPETGNNNTWYPVTFFFN